MYAQDVNWAIDGQKNTNQPSPSKRVDLAKGSKNITQ